MAPTIAVSTPLAVSAEYVQASGSDTRDSIARSPSASTDPRSAPPNGRSQRLPLTYCRARNLAAHMQRNLRAAAAGGLTHGG